MKVETCSDVTSLYPTDFAAEVKDLPALTSHLFEKPTLTSPSELRLLDITNEAHDLGEKLLEVFGMRLDATRAKVSEITAKNIEKLKETAERMRDSSFWGTLKKIATYLLSAIPLVFGISCVASGDSALAGGAMIASGILSLAHFAINETESWDWIVKLIAQDNKEQQEKLKQILPMAFGIVSAACGFASLSWSAYANASHFAQNAVSVAQTVLGLFNAGITLKKGATEARVQESQADQALFQSALKEEDIKHKSLVQEIGAFLQGSRSARAHIKRIVEETTQSNINLTRGG